MDNDRAVQVFGEEGLATFLEQKNILSEQEQLNAQVKELSQQLNSIMRTGITAPDVIVSIASGVMMGLFDALFKQFVPQHGSLKHDHDVKRTAVDYKVAKPQGTKGSVQDLHRQVGPGHDVFRFKEALELMSGKTSDFPLWGKKASDFTGGKLHPGNMRFDEFILRGGFRIPNNPKAELMNHLIIDFFTKRSLPIPGTSFIADHSEACAKVMMKMYDEGLNLKNFVGGLSATILLEVLIRGYAILFKAIIPVGGEAFKSDDNDAFITVFKNVLEANKNYTRSNEFYMQGMIAHGSSFLLDTLITTGSKSYAGLFQLNYGSLIAFAGYVTKYLLECHKKRQNLVFQSDKARQLLLYNENDWYQGFKENIQMIALNDGFTETFSPAIILERNKETSMLCNEIGTKIERKRDLNEIAKGIDIGE